MARLVMWNLMTLDGMFEGSEPWDLGFHDYAWGEELKQFSLEQTREIGGLIFGRRTYEGMAAYWPTAKGETPDFMNAVPKYVFSHTLERADWSNTTLLKEEAASGVARLKEQSGKDLYVMGSAELSETLSRHGLIDEYRIALVSTTLGQGTPLFKPGAEPVRLRQVEARPLGDRCVMLRLQPAA